MKKETSFDRLPAAFITAKVKSYRPAGTGVGHQDEANLIWASKGVGRDRGTHRLARGGSLDFGPSSDEVVVRSVTVAVIRYCTCLKLRSGLNALI